jgi:hypothetical protein
MPWEPHVVLLNFLGRIEEIFNEDDFRRETPLIRERVV